ncbi:hypothetical protein HK100_011830 [Physocladia obscura]|uniref:C2H2-type domain-containing protein n=1 Tax=Physocladia obscura TaxID=109957 RepID=A0AAD5TB06_9FUNG|nr:hypothetical protein HK100_011830 [Physocladia obscura]
MLRENDLIVPESKLTHNGAIGNFAGQDACSQWEVLRGRPTSFYQESANQLALKSDHYNHTIGSGMIGNPTNLIPSNASSSSTINDYENNFLPFNDNYIYAHDFNSGNSLQTQSVDMFQYKESDASQLKSSIFHSASFSFDSSQAQYDGTTSSNQQEQNFDKQKNLYPNTFRSNGNMGPDSFGTITAGGMEGFIGAWNYDGTLPLSMMHSPSRNLHQIQNFPINEATDPSSTSQQHFISHSFSFPSQLYPSPQMHDNDPSTFAMNDSTPFMMFYGTPRISNIAGSISNELNERHRKHHANPHQPRLSKQKTSLNSHPKKNFTTQSNLSGTQPKKKDTAAASSQSLASSSSNTYTISSQLSKGSTRNTRGQVIIMKDSGAMIAEPDSDHNDGLLNVKGGGGGVPRRYMCSVCSKRFTRPSTLRTHMNSHTGYKREEGGSTEVESEQLTVNDVERDCKQ